MDSVRLMQQLELIRREIHLCAGLPARLAESKLILLIGEIRGGQAQPAGPLHEACEARRPVEPEPSPREE